VNGRMDLSLVITMLQDDRLDYGIDVSVARLVGSLVGQGNTIPGRY